MARDTDACKLKLLETIKIEDRIPRNLLYHNERMNSSRSRLFASVREIDLCNEIAVPDYAWPGIWKCRIVYAEEIESIEFTPYAIPRVTSLAIVRDDLIEYGHKALDRSAIALCYGRRGSADDVVIVKNGLVTDASFANLAFFDGSAWYTPARPLLEGTKRRSYLEKGILREADIRQADLNRFERVSLVNAMLDLDVVSVPAGAIIDTD